MTDLRMLNMIKFPYTIDTTTQPTTTQANKTSNSLALGLFHKPFHHDSTYREQESAKASTQKTE